MLMIFLFANMKPNLTDGIPNDLEIMKKISAEIIPVISEIEVAGNMINKGWTPVSGASFDDGKIFHTLVKEPKNV